MKRILLLCFAVIGISTIGRAETPLAGGKVTGRIFTDAYVNTIGDYNSASMAFEVTRAYFGYSNEFAEGWSAFVLLDIGSINDDSEYALIRRYTYFKNAGLKYKKNGWELQLGLIGTYQFKLQEKLWGKRYIRKSFQDEFKFNSSADLGFFVKKSLNDIFDVDFMIANGEGYKDFQYDDFLRYSAGVVAKPADFQFRAGIDLAPNNDNINTVYTLYGGYKGEKFKLGADFTLEQNYKNREGYTRQGGSVFGELFLSDKLSIFGRYDMIYSNILEGDERPWNLSKDGSALVGGLEYSVNKHMRASLNYQDWMPYAKNLDYASAIYLNLEINF
ncbi:hypothetical protein ACE1ET_07600 [Saccharicrinis sp. FJH62]|uniref:hypothetical protein n=1 Tax=Saccharicrinis sp. FJH62 TaxID=3344657 RepID=UPI0035D4F55D